MVCVAQWVFQQQMTKKGCKLPPRDRILMGIARKRLAVGKRSVTCCLEDCVVRGGGLVVRRRRQARARFPGLRQADSPLGLAPLPRIETPCELPTANLPPRFVGCEYISRPLRHKGQEFL